MEDAAMGRTLCSMCLLMRAEYGSALLLSMTGAQLSRQQASSSIDRWQTLDPTYKRLLTVG